MSRQSYLASEVRWGYQFVRCIHRPHGEDTNYTVDTAKCASRSRVCCSLRREAPAHLQARGKAGDCHDPHCRSIPAVTQKS